VAPVWIAFGTLEKCDFGVEIRSVIWFEIAGERLHSEKMQLEIV
jgi:hypothetical protein